MKKAELAAAWAEGVAADESHGYDQHSRWGPDYDCSSLVIAAYESAGVPVRTRGATYTGNMRGVFLKCGFRDVTGEVSLSSGAGLQRGDVLLNTARHAALYLGGGRLLQAGGNERGGVTGGTAGDQTGREIGVSGYYSFPWDCVLRYEEETGEDPSTPPGGDPQDDKGGGAPGDDGGVYIVQRGDSLWSVAERLLGSGTRYPALMELNGLTDAAVYPGQRLRLPGGAAAEKPSATAEERCSPSLPVLRQGAAGPAVTAAQTLLLLRGGALPVWGADGDFGPETAAAVRDLRSTAGLAADGAVDAGVWEALVEGA